MNPDPPAASFSQVLTESSSEMKRKLKQEGGLRAAPHVTETVSVKCEVARLRTSDRAGELRKSIRETPDFQKSDLE